MGANLYEETLISGADDSIAVLTDEYRKALKLRDGGAEAKKVWGKILIKIQKISSSVERVRILQGFRPPEWQ